MTGFEPRTSVIEATALLTEPQVWPDWAIFESSLKQICVKKVAQKPCQLIRPFWKGSLRVKIPVASIWASFETFYSNIG